MRMRVVAGKHLVLPERNADGRLHRACRNALQTKRGYVGEADIIRPMIRRHDHQMRASVVGAEDQMPVWPPAKRISSKVILVGRRVSWDMRPLKRHKDRSATAS